MLLIWHDRWGWRLKAFTLTVEWIPDCCHFTGVCRRIRLHNVSICKLSKESVWRRYNIDYGLTTCSTYGTASWITLYLDIYKTILIAHVKTGQLRWPVHDQCTPLKVSKWHILSKMCMMLCSHFVSTVVPALGDPRRERPPALYGHVINAPTDTFQR